jgi:hypothetical protein
LVSIVVGFLSSGGLFMVRLRLDVDGSLFRCLTLKFRLQATNSCHVHSYIYESDLLHCRNQLLFAFGRAAACSWYVWALTVHYFVISHYSFDCIRLTLVTFIRLYMSVTCSILGINYGWLLVERRLVHGTFGWYVWMLTRYYFVISHSRFGLMR